MSTPSVPLDFSPGFGSVTRPPDLPFGTSFCDDAHVWRRVTWMKLQGEALNKETIQIEVQEN